MQSEIEVMRVVRVPPMGALVVQTESGRYSKVGDLKNEKARRRLLAAIGELIGFAGGYDALVKAGVAPPLPGSELPISPNSQDEEVLTREQAAFLDQLEREVRANTLTNVPDLLSPDVELTEISSRRYSEPIREAPESGQVNLVAQIDAILQKHVAASDLLAHRSIHLRQTQGDHLQIIVDGEVYHHPNDIEDEGVKRALKRALQEWETR